MLSVSRLKGHLMFTSTLGDEVEAPDGLNSHTTNFPGLHKVPGAYFAHRGSRHVILNKLNER